MPKVEIQLTRSSNCIAWVVASKAAYSGIESSRVSSETASAIRRTPAPPLPLASRTQTPPRIGVQMTRLR